MPLFADARALLLVDAPAGIAGDMFLAGLADLGFDLDELARAFAAAGVADLRLGSEEARSGGLRVRRLVVEAPDDQPARHLADCLDLVARLGLPAPAADLAGRLFTRLADVEARAHGTDIQSVHFHEVGALDSLVDITGAALGLYRLGVGAVILRDLAIGRGTASMAHGTLPLPAPATLALLEGLPVRESGLDAELVTPTGALILAETARPATAGLAWRPLRTGYGAGTRSLPDRPNLLRLTLAEALPVPAPPDGAPAPGEGPAAPRHALLTVLRCTVDDMNPERCGYLMERLFDAGARDVRYRPLQMKKNRPGLEIEVLAYDEQAPALTELLFTETSTLGLRVAREERLELQRERAEVETPYGVVAVKVAVLPDGRRRAAPEYEDCARLARERGVPLAEVEEAARAAWRDREAAR